MALENFHQRQKLFYSEVENLYNQKVNIDEKRDDLFAPSESFVFCSLTKTTEYFL